ncbi:MAG: DNA polymerase III subunit delta [Ignavibacteriaceae bacterium]|nr:DNA polymerase III subunit delta [Ignavibacteriaceae bacterium]
MAKTKVNIPAISQIKNELLSRKILPVYFFLGEDSYSIEAGSALVEETVKPMIESDFDRETFYGEDKNLSDILNFASAFPFGSGKKLIILKEFEKIKDKKQLTSYVNSPQSLTVLVIINNGAVSNLDAEPYKSLIEKKYIFEGKELKGENLVEWLTENVKLKGKVLTSENARLLIDIVGENREMLEAQLEKIFVFLNDSKEITLDSIKSLSTSLKEYNIFDLQNAIGKKDKTLTLKVAYNMLDKGAEPTYIIHMLTRYFTGLSRVNELTAKKIPDQAAARIVGTHPFYYKDHLRARKIFTDSNLYRIVQSLLKADLSVKTTSSDNKTIITILLSEIVQ